MNNFYSILRTFKRFIKIIYNSCVIHSHLDFGNGNAKGYDKMGKYSTSDYSILKLQDLI